MQKQDAEHRKVCSAFRLKREKRLSKRLHTFQLTIAQNKAISIENAKRKVKEKRLKKQSLVQKPVDMQMDSSRLSYCINVFDIRLPHFSTVCKLKFNY